MLPIIGVAICARFHPFTLTFKTNKQTNKHVFMSMFTCVAQGVTANIGSPKEELLDQSCSINAALMQYVSKLPSIVLFHQSLTLPLPPVY